MARARAQLSSLWRTILKRSFQNNRSSAGTAHRDHADRAIVASLITPQWRTEEALRLRLAELGGAVEFGAALASFEQSDEGVSAVVVKGGEAETVAARWLVGCDGGHSIVRKQAGIAFEGETREDVRMIVADVGADGLDRDAWRIWWHEEGVGLRLLPSTDIFPLKNYICSSLPAPCQRSRAGGHGPAREQRLGKGQQSSRLQPIAGRPTALMRARRVLRRSRSAGAFRSVLVGDSPSA